MFDRILVALEVSATDMKLVESLPLIARPETKFVLAHVVHPSEGTEYGGVFEQPLNLRVQASRRNLDEWEQALRARGYDVSSRVVMGEPSERLLALAKETEASALVLATHGRSGPARWVDGSVTEAVLRRSGLPVWVFNPEQQVRKVEHLRRLLVPMDGSERAMRILDLVRPLAIANDAEVTLLRVGVHPSVHFDEVTAGAVYSSPIPSLKVALRTSLAPALKRLTGVRVKTRVRLAESASAGIVDEGREGRYDAIAIATHGLSGLDRLLFGSTAEGVARAAPLPLLVLRDQPETAEPEAEEEVLESSAGGGGPSEVPLESIPL